MRDSTPARPRGWVSVRLSYLASKPITAGADAVAAPMEDGDVRYIRTTDILGLRQLRPALEAVGVSPAFAQQALVMSGDVLMTRSGSLGTSLLYEGAAACYAGYLVRFRPNRSKCFGPFIAWWTHSKDHSDQIAVGATRSTIDNFSASKFSAMRLVLPPLTEQRAIADYLDRETAKIDTLIEKQTTMIERLRERRVAVIAAAVAGNGSASSMTWPSVALHYLVQFGNGRDYSDVEALDGPYPVIGSGGPFTSTDQFLFDGESVLFGRKGTIDKPRYQTGRFWTVDTMFYSVPGPRIVPKWLYYWALTIPFGLHSTSTALPSMTSAVLGRLRVLLPPLDEQREIADYLDRETAKIDTLIAKVERHIELARERRAALITAAVTGQIDVTISTQSGDAA